MLMRRGRKSEAGQNCASTTQLPRRFYNEVTAPYVRMCLSSCFIALTVRGRGVAMAPIPFAIAHDDYYYVAYSPS
jgi:hypothetical protein